MKNQIHIIQNRLASVYGMTLVLLFLFFANTVVYGAGTFPTMDRTSPSTPVYINTGQTQTFGAEATAGSGIYGIEWFVGSSSKKYTSYTSSYIYYKAESFSYTFNSVGTYYVYAYVYDRESPQREALTYWQVVVSTPPPSAPSGVSASDGTYTDCQRSVKMYHPRSN